MDYSLLVAIKDAPGGAPPGGGHDPSDLGWQPLVYRSPQGHATAVYIAIIDFLQAWTMGKRVARILKFMECNKATVPPRSYAARFHEHFAQHLQALPENDPVRMSAPKVASESRPADEAVTEGGSE